MTFEEGVSRLKRYIEEYGNALVPYSYKDKDGVLLGKWVSRQRELYHSCRLSADRIAVLNELDFVWEVDHKAAQRKAVSDAFEMFYEHLVAFKAEFGHCDVKQSYVSPDGYRLGATANKIRVRPERRTEEQIRKLHDIDFPFVSSNKPWFSVKNNK